MFAQERSIDRNTLRQAFRTQMNSDMLTHPICKICDIADWDHPEFRERVIEVTGWPPEKDLRHRKLWEFAQTVRALKAYHLLNERAVGLSVAAGREKLLFYLANCAGRVVATDLYGEGNFASREADKRFLTDQRSFAEMDYPEDRLKALYMNALRLQFEEHSFDFAYSLSSIEHFGGLDAAIQSLREMVRVVKPGGLIVIATECLLSHVPTFDVFTPEEIDVLVERSGASLIEPISYHVSDRTLQAVTDFDHGDLHAFPQINMRRDSGAVFTSIVLALQKPMSFETTQRYPLLQTDLTWLDEDVEAIRNIYPQEAMPRLTQQGVPAMLLESPYTRLPLLGRLWQRLRRPLHKLITFYLDEQARRQAEDLNSWLETHLYATLDKMLKLDRASRTRR